MRKITFLSLLFVAVTLLACGQRNHTQQSEPTHEPYFFLQMSDPQLGFIDNNASFAQDSKLFQQAIDIANGLKPDFVVITGDFVNASKSESQIKEFKRLLKGFDPSIPVYLIPGNHDISDSDATSSYQTYLKNYGYDRFSFNHKGSLFVGINSVLVKNSELQTKEIEQFKWLTDELVNSQENRQRFVFMHHSLFVKKVDESDNYSNFQAPMREKYLSLLGDQHVSAVFAGHAHYNSVASNSELKMLTCGSTGKPLGKGFPGMHIVKVYHDSFTSEYLSLNEFPSEIVF